MQHEAAYDGIGEAGPFSGRHGGNPFADGVVGRAAPIDVQAAAVRAYRLESHGTLRCLGHTMTKGPDEIVAAATEQNPLRDAFKPDKPVHIAMRDLRHLVQSDQL